MIEWDQWPDAPRDGVARRARSGSGNLLFVALALWLTGALPPLGHSGALRAADANEEFVQAVVSLLGSGDADFRAAGLEQVRTAAKGSELTRLFAAQLPQLDVAGQVALLSALGDRGDLTARPAIGQLLSTNRDERVRAAALAALGKLSDPADLPLLLKSLSAESETERAAARASLLQLRGEAITPALLAQAQSAQPAVQAVLIEVLAQRRAVDAVPYFLAAARQADPTVRLAAMSAIGQLAPPDKLPQLLPAVLQAAPGAERDAAEKNVALVCARIENQEQRGTAFIEALQTVAPAERDQLLSLVGRVGGPKLIQFVAEIAASADPERRRLGIDALSKWPDAGTADTLLALAERASDADERKRAFEGFVRIGALRDLRSDLERLERMKQARQAARSPAELLTVVYRSRTAYHVETLRFVLPFVDDAQLGQMACETVVELAHHREIRDPHKAEFDRALDKVIAVSRDPVVVDRAQRYQRGETWERPKK